MSRTSPLPWALFALLLGACENRPDPNTVEGAIRYMAEAIEADDARRMFKVIDERSRHAMISIVSDRKHAAATIRESYPAPMRERALTALGDAATVEDGAALFALRCDQTCRRGIAERLGAPASVQTEGERTRVRTARDTELLLYRGGDGEGWYGLVWRTQALFEERDRASRDRRMIEENAATYARRRALEAGAR